MGYWLALVVGLLAAQLAELNGDLMDDVAQFNKLGSEHPYNQINEALCRRLKTDDYKENAELLAKWYDQVKGQEFSWSSKKLRATALRLLTEAERQRAAGTWCQDGQFEELARLNKQEIMKHVVGLRRRQLKGMLMCNRVIQIFFMQTLNHLKLCAEFYQQNLPLLVDQLNEFRLHDGDRALEPLIGSIQARLKVGGLSLDLVRALRQQLAEGELELELELIELTAESIVQFVRPSVSDGMGIEKLRERVFDHLNKGIYEPCTYLSSNLRATLGPASLDLENLDEFWQGGKQAPNVEQKMRSYGPDVYKLWAKYLLCNKLLELDYAQLGGALLQRLL